MAKLRRGALAVGIVVALFGGGNSPVAAASDPVIAPAAAPLAPAAIGDPSTLVAVAPARIADTRSAIGGMQRPVAGDTTIDIQVIGAGGVPDGATSVVLNVTAVDPQTSGFFTVFPSGTTRPDASNLNFVAGTAAGRFYPFVPNRAFDTRTSPRINGVVAPIGQAGVLNLTLRNELPATSHYAAVLVNVTATRATSGGYLTVYPTGDVLPTSSNLNFKVGQTVANAVIVKLGPNETRFVPVGGAGGAPAGAIGVVLNATVTGTTAGSYLSVWPAGLTQPTVSSLNWGPGETVPNFVGVAVLSAGGTAGQLAIYNDAGAADVLVDVTGYFYPVA